ncbi:MAG: hypothetical protein ACJ741_04365 [Pyrinomonadaceae bacterium]
MAKNESKRLTPSALDADKNAFAALKTVSGYTPANSTYTLTAISAAQAAVATKQQAEVQAAAALATARDEAVAAEWAFHNLMLGAKDQVIAQFGRDSNEVQAVGRKKASEFKPRVRRAQKAQP